MLDHGYYFRGRRLDFVRQGCTLSRLLREPGPIINLSIAFVAGNISLNIEKKHNSER